MSGSLLGSRVECEGADTSYGDSDTKPAETCKGLHGMPAIKVSGTKYEIGEEVYRIGVCSMYMVGGDIGVCSMYMVGGDIGVCSMYMVGGNIVSH